MGIFDQIEVYYEDVMTVEVEEFAQTLKKVLDANMPEEAKLTKLTSRIGMASINDKSKEVDVFIDQMALPDRGNVDKDKLRKDEKDANAGEGAEDEVILAGVSQGNIKASMETFSELVLEDFDMTFGNVKLLQNASVQFNRGQRFGLVGRNGSGKSTMLRLIGS